MTLSISIDFQFLLKFLTVIVILIPSDVIMTSRPDQIKLELVRRISCIIVVNFCNYIAAMWCIWTIWVTDCC